MDTCFHSATHCLIARLTNKATPFVALSLVTPVILPLTHPKSHSSLSFSLVLLNANIKLLIHKHPSNHSPFTIKCTTSTSIQEPSLHVSLRHYSPLFVCALSFVGESTEEGLPFLLSRMSGRKYKGSVLAALITVQKAM